jgi:hypothetical protein
VIVGNVGTTYDGNDIFIATTEFNHYVRESALGNGRAKGEEVTLMEDDEIKNDYIPGRRSIKCTTKKTHLNGQR